MGSPRPGSAWSGAFLALRCELRSSAYLEEALVEGLGELELSAGLFLPLVEVGDDEITADVEHVAVAEGLVEHHVTDIDGVKLLLGDLRCFLPWLFFEIGPLRRSLHRGCRLGFADRLCDGGRSVSSVATCLTVVCSK